MRPPSGSRLASVNEIYQVRCRVDVLFSNKIFNETVLCVQYPQVLTLSGCAICTNLRPGIMEAHCKERANCPG